MKKSKIYLTLLCTMIFVFSFSITVFADSDTYSIYYYTGTTSTSVETYVFSEYGADLECYVGIGYNKLVPIWFVSTEPFTGKRNNRYTVTPDYDDTYGLYYFSIQPTGYYSNSSNIKSVSANVNYSSSFKYDDNNPLKTQAFAMFLNEHPTVEPSTEEPTTEPTTEEPTTEPNTEEPTIGPSTEEPTSEPTTEPITPIEPDTPTDNGTVTEFVTDLIGTEELFTPQNVMAIFVICLITECISYIASALLSTGGLK